MSKKDSIPNMIQIAGRRFVPKFDLKAIKEIELATGTPFTELTDGQSISITALLSLLEHSIRHQSGNEDITQSWLLENVSPDDLIVEISQVLNHAIEAAFPKVRKAQAEREKLDNQPPDSLTGMKLKP